MQETDFYSIRWFIIEEADISIQQFLPFSTPCILVLPNVRSKDKFQIKNKGIFSSIMKEAIQNADKYL